eukprot:PhM_4_TR2419/c1_g1_i12/m.74259
MQVSPISRTSLQVFLSHRNRTASGCGAPVTFTPCRLTVDFSAGYGETKKHKLFSAAMLADMPSEAAYAVKKYGVVLPSGGPLCSPVDVTLPSGAVKAVDTASQLDIAHTALMSVVKDVYDTMYITPCPRGYDTVDTLHIQWYVVPSFASYETAATSEPIYMYSDGSVLSWPDAVKACESFRPFGMVGYLMTVDEANA